MEADLLVTNAMVLTMDDDMKMIQKGFVAVKGNEILEVGEMKDLPSDLKAKDTMDCKHQILMPGFINTHTHSPMTMFRGFADDLPLMEWLTQHIWPAEGIYTKNDEAMRTAAENAVIELLKSGCTTLVDGYFQGELIGEVFNRIGIRGFFGEGLLDVFPAPSGTDYKYFWEKVVPAFEKFEIVEPFIFPHSIYACTTELLKKCKEDMDKHKNMLFSIHACETLKEVEDCKKQHGGMTPIEYLDSLGLLTNRTILAHCCHLSENDIKLIKDREVGISHNVSSNMKLTSGIFPFKKIWDSGNRKVSIGTDGASSNNGLEMIREMNILSKLHKVNSMDPTVCRAEEVVYMATRGGAKCLGRDNVLGSIEKGKLADFIIIDTLKTHLQPVYNPYSLIVYAMTGSDIEHVFVNGKCVVKNRKMMKIDEKEVVLKMIELGKKINEAVHKNTKKT